MEKETAERRITMDTPDNGREYTLLYPYKQPTGVMLDKLTLRRAKVRDLKAAQKRGDSPADVEVVLISLVCQPALTPEDLEDMDCKDYAAIQGFLR
jgi:hypothetical protein